MKIEIGVAWKIFINQNIKGSVRQWYPYSTRLDKDIVSIILIYGDRAIFLIFYDNTDTESKSSETEMSISKPIFTQKIYIKGSLAQGYPYSTSREENIVVVLRFHGLLAVLYYF